MKRYQCKHAVEAMQWNGDGVMPLEKWHEEHTGMRVRWICTTPSVLLGDSWHDMDIGEWLVWFDGEFLVMDDERFRDTYEAVP